MLTIRDVPDSVKEALARDARDRGQSLQAFLLSVLTRQAAFRQNERLLQTQVFVRGRCVGKLASAYSNPVNAIDSAEKQRLGLTGLTTEQLAALDAAIAAYTRGEKTVAVQQAVAQVEQQAAVKVKQAEQKAAATAVEVIPPG